MNFLRVIFPVSIQNMTDWGKKLFLPGPFPPPLKASLKPHVTYVFKDTNITYTAIPWTDFFISRV